VDYNTATSRRLGNCQTGTNAEWNDAPTSAKTTRKGAWIFNVGSGDDDPYGRISASRDAPSGGTGADAIRGGENSSDPIQNNREAARSR
jgi:hypothetical protein